MGFLSGSITCERYRVTEDPTDTFGEDHLEKLAKRRIDSSKTNLYETAAYGYTGGAHLLDTSFDLAKNVIGDAMHFGVRIDSCSIPGSIKRAWMAIELSGIMKDNPGGRPSKAQREEAQESVEARCADEAAKGNYQRMAATPILWDATTETVYLGSTSEKVNDSCLSLLNESFELEFKRVTSGSLAEEIADEQDQMAGLFQCQPTAFNEEHGGQVIWWNGMGDNYDYLGNEFLLWLWWHFETASDTIELSDGTEVSGMFARSLLLDCPAGENGKESISSECPAALPEAMMAIRMGKLPRKAGLTLVRDGEQYDFTLQAETFSVGSARISQSETGSSRDVLDRVESIRQLWETLDLLFEVFCKIRLGKKWDSTADKIRTWLTTDRPIRKRQKQSAA